MQTFKPTYLQRTLGCVVLTLASLTIDCRKLTAEPAKPAVARPSSFVVAESVYDGSLKPGWQDWGWGPHDLSKGAARLNFSSYGGWILHHDPVSTRFGALVFRMKAPSAAGRFLEVRLAGGEKDESFPPLEVGPEYGRPAADGWVEYYVPWSELSPSGAPFDRITLRAKTPIGADWILFDKLGFTQFDAKAAKAAAQAAPVRRVKLAASCSAKGHAISPYIYGVVGDADDLGETTLRWGGNPTTRYNWQLGNTTNVGKDWFFENTKTGPYDEFLSRCRKRPVPGALTVPLIGWVAKDTGSFGFPVSVYGAQQSTDQWKPDAGNGVRTDGSEIVPKAPTQTSVEAPPEFIGRWVETIVKQAQKYGSRTITQYILDNEPNLWSINHRDVHPAPLTYDELLDRTIRYGTAIRKADPGALIAGPAEWGWSGYFDSARDSKVGLALRPDRRAHGDVPLIPWYLSKLREHEKSTGTKLLDVLDVHFYPQGQGVYGNNADSATAALRIRSTRALWDPTYKDESWINEPVRLLPRLKEWVAQNYPGLAISIGEYNFGGEQHMSGALAEAEALGRFGIAGIDYAYYWVVPAKGSPAYWAFRAFRNFDGKKGHFLERSMDTQMDSDVSLFASRDESGKHLVLIALNLSPTTSARANIALPGCAPIATGRRFSYGPQTTSLVDEGAIASGPLDVTLLPYSINVFDVNLK
ncbi:MAG: glycoside hydrolase family 44 protein [Pseudomonadota bacterium]